MQMKHLKIHMYISHVTLFKNKLETNAAERADKICSVYGRNWYIDPKANIP